MGIPQQVVGAFEVALVAFEIRFEQELVSRWEGIESEARESIINAPTSGKKAVLRRFFNDAKIAVATVTHDRFQNLHKVATAHRERLAGQAPLTWTVAKIFTQACNFLVVDETFVETAAPRDSSRVLSTAQRIVTGVGWLDGGCPDDFVLPGWAGSSRFARLLSCEPVASPAQSAAEPLSREETLTWVKYEELSILKRLSHQIELECLEGMIEAGKDRIDRTDLRAPLTLRSRDRKATTRPPDRMVINRRAIIQLLPKEVKGEAYCRALDGKLSTPISWQKNENCPKRYLDAYWHSDPVERKKWRHRISDEKYKAPQNTQLANNSNRRVSSDTQKYVNTAQTDLPFWFRHVK